MEHISLSAYIMKKAFHLIKFKDRFTLEFLVKNGKSPSNMRPAFRMFKKFDCIQSLCNDHVVWKIQQKNSSPKTHILFFHGGAYIQTFTYFHWNLISYLVKELNCVVHAPNYPLAPEHQVPQTIEFSIELYKIIIVENEIENLIIMGDSAGGGLSLALVQQLAQQKIQLPDQLILIAPWLDISMQNEDIQQVTHLDPILSIQGLLDAGQAYAGDLSLTHPLVSPIYGQLSNLPPISFFVGSHDILYPDAVKLYQKLQEEGNECIFYESPQMIHDWLLYPFKESFLDRKELIKHIKTT